MAKPENPPAFPNHPAIQIDGRPNDWAGMTLRDWFAGHLAAAELASAGANEHAAEALCEAAANAGQTIEQRIAFNAYTIADAMLSARQTTDREDGK